MPSNAILTLNKLLLDVDEIISAHTALTGGGRGKPAMRQGQAITRAGVVLLCGAMEKFFENLFEEAVRLIYTDATPEELKLLFGNTSKRLNHPSINNVTAMYFSIGMNHPLSLIRWKKMSNESFIQAYTKFTEKRGAIAHGNQPVVRLDTLRKWKILVQLLATKLEGHVADHIEKVTGNRPRW